jgi:hypothetical protein
MAIAFNWLQLVLGDFRLFVNIVSFGLGNIIKTLIWFFSILFHLKKLEGFYLVFFDVHNI